MLLEEIAVDGVEAGLVVVWELLPSFVHSLCTVFFAFWLSSLVLSFHLCLYFAFGGWGVIVDSLLLHNLQADSGVLSVWCVWRFLYFFCSVLVFLGVSVCVHIFILA